MNTAIAISTESPKVFFSNGRLVTTSQAVADYFDKQHKHVLAKIDALDCSPEFTSANFSADVQNIEIGNGAQRESRCFLITKDGFMFLVMGFTGKKAAHLKEAYIAKFNAMAAELRASHDKPIKGDSRTLLIRLDEHGNIKFTEKVPDNASVCTLERFEHILKQQGFLIIPKCEITKAVTDTLERLTLQN